EPLVSEPVLPPGNGGDLPQWTASLRGTGALVAGTAGVDASGRLGRDGSAGTGIPAGATGAAGAPLSAGTADAAARLRVCRARSPKRGHPFSDSLSAFPRHSDGNCVSEFVGSDAGARHFSRGALLAHGGAAIHSQVRLEAQYWRSLESGIAAHA